MATLVVCGLPEAGRLRAQRRESAPTTLRDVYGAPELLFMAPPLPTSLLATLPHLCMPDGVEFRNTPPPPPRFFTTMLPGSDGAAAHLACCLFFEERPVERLMPLLDNIVADSQCCSTASGSSVGREARARSASGGGDDAPKSHPVAGSSPEHISQPGHEDRTPCIHSAPMPSLGSARSHRRHRSRHSHRHSQEPAASAK